MGNPSRQSTVSARATADALGVNEHTVRRWIDQGTMTAVKVRGTYRIAPEEIERPRVAVLGEGLGGVVEVHPRHEPDKGGCPVRLAGPDAPVPLWRAARLPCRSCAAEAKAACPLPCGAPGTDGAEDGCATALAVAVAAEWVVGTEELVHTPPFSRAGRALAKSIIGGGGVLVA